MRPPVNNPTLTQVLPQSQNHLVAHTAKQLNNQHPKSHHLGSLRKSHKHKKRRNTPTQSLLLTNLQIDLVLLDTLPHFTPQSVIPYPPIKIKTQIHQTQAQQHQINTQSLLPYSGFLPNTTLPPPVLIPAPPRAPQPELLHYSNTPQFSTKPINFANTDKTLSSELPQPIHTVSHINDTTHDISLLSDISISDSTSSQISSPTPSQIASNPFNPPQGPVTKFERLLSQAHWNHSFNMVNSSAFFQNSIPLSFTGTPSVINLSSNTPTPDPDQHFHHFIGKHPDTTRTYPTLPLKIDNKFIVPPPALFGDHNNGEQLHNWAKQRISKSYKITPVQKLRTYKLLKQSKIIFSVEIVVEQDKLIFHPQAAAPPIF